MVTIQDVAKAAGVSPMTVSHVINEHPNVRDTTRARVLEAITALNYRVNHAARNLRSGRTGTIALAVPEVDRPYFAQLAAAVLDAARKHQLRVVIEQTGASREGELDALALSHNRLYDGLILSTVGLGTADVGLLRVDFPMVLLGERIFHGPLDHVAMPNAEAARAATLHLIERGSRKVAMIGGLLEDDVAMGPLRTAGYRAALEQSELSLNPDLLIELPVNTTTAGVEAAHRMVDADLQFDGAFCITDTVAIGFLRGLADRGVRVPDDVRVIGFDNIAETAFTVPTLSSVNPDTAGMAARAVDLLVAQIGRRQAGSWEPTEHISTFHIVDRESSR